MLCGMTMAISRASWLWISTPQYWRLTCGQWISSCAGGGTTAIEVNAEDWHTHSVVSLRELSVETSQPVLVKRSRWYCWFPSLIR